MNFSKREVKFICSRNEIRGMHLRITLITFLSDTFNLFFYFSVIIYPTKILVFSFLFDVYFEWDTESQHYEDSDEISESCPTKFESSSECTVREKTFSMRFVKVKMYISPVLIILSRLWKKDIKLLWKQDYFSIPQNTVSMIYMYIYKLGEF